MGGDGEHGDNVGQEVGGRAVRPGECEARVDQEVEVGAGDNSGGLAAKGGG